MTLRPAGNVSPTHTGYKHAPEKKSLCRNDFPDGPRRRPFGGLKDGRCPLRTALFEGVDRLDMTHGQTDVVEPLHEPPPAEIVHREVPFVAAGPYLASVQIDRHRQFRVLLDLLPKNFDKFQVQL